MDPLASEDQEKSPATQRIKLPRNIPAAWLKDIKATVKESKTKLILTTILGSSLLGVILNVTGNYYTNLYVENQKASNLINGKKAEKIFASYEKLYDAINKLEKSLQDVDLVLRFLINGENKEVAKNLPANLEELTVHKIAFDESLGDAWIQEDTHQRIGTAFDSLLESIEAVQNTTKAKQKPDLKAYQDLEELCKKLADGEQSSISPIKRHLNEKMKAIDPNKL